MNDTCRNLFSILDEYIQDVFKQANGVFPVVGNLVPARMNMFIGMSMKMFQDLAVSRGLSPAQVVIWLGITAADLKEQDLTSNRKMIKNVSLDKAEWRLP